MSQLLAMRSEIVRPESILQFRSGEVDNVFLTIGVRQGLARSKYYGMKLISGGFEVLKDLARKGIIVKRLYATGRTPDGIRLSRDLGFTEKIIPGSDVRRFELDIETSDSPFLQEYREIINTSGSNGHLKQKRQQRGALKIRQHFIVLRERATRTRDPVQKRATGSLVQHQAHLPTKKSAQRQGRERVC